MPASSCWGWGWSGWRPRCGSAGAVVLIGDPSAEAVPSAAHRHADAEYAGYLATKRLLDLGHRRIAYALRHARGAGAQRKRRWRGHERALREAASPIRIR